MFFRKFAHKFHVNMNNGCNLTYAELWRSLTPLYEPNEAKAIVRTILETKFDMSMADILCYGTSQMSDVNREVLCHMMQRLTDSEPVQYVLGEAEFAGRTFHVEPGVLIPRPETEILCQWVNKACHTNHPKILDIGCGSGCIAITLALNIAGAQATALDISQTAIKITQENAKALGANIRTIQANILDLEQTLTCGGNKNDKYDIIVSNPPYVCKNEARDMHKNVLLHEPHIALFVPDNDPLLFYKAITHYAQEWLNTDGMLFFECNPAYLNETADMLRSNGFEHVEAKDDNFGKTRHLKASRK